MYAPEDAFNQNQFMQGPPQAMGGMNSGMGSGMAGIGQSLGQNMGQPMGQMNQGMSQNMNGGMGPGSMGPGSMGQGMNQGMAQGAMGGMAGMGSAMPQQQGMPVAQGAPGAMSAGGQMMGGMQPGMQPAMQNMQNTMQPALAAGGAGMSGMQAFGTTMPMVASTAMGAMANMAGMAGMTPAMQAMYQQYAMRWAAMQRFAAQAAAQGLGLGMGMTDATGAAAYGFMGDGTDGMGGSGAAGGMGGAGGVPGGAFYKTRVCMKWKEGTCTYGDKCRYAHGEHELRTPDMNAGMAAMGDQGAGFGKKGPVALEKRQAIEMMKKTRLCQEFMTSGACKYGDRCTFAHGQHELRVPPPHGEFQPRGAQQQPFQPAPNKDAMRKTRLCDKFMQTGTCPYGEKCSFAHGTHELRSRSGQQQQAQQPQIGPQPQDSSPPGYEQQDNGSGEYAEPAEPADTPASAGGGGKRSRGDSDAQYDTVEPSKRQHQESEELPPEAIDCPLCSQLVAQGKHKVLNAANALENPKAKQVACMIIAASQRLDQLWSKATPTMVFNWISKAGLSITDKIELLKTVFFHVHEAPTEEGQEGQGLDSAKYVAQGLPREVADFVYMVMEGKEGTATMPEYFHMLEVCKTLFGVNDDNYYTVSSAVAGIMMGT